jgi:hypothetical protein
MSRKSVLLGLGILVLLAAGVTAGLVLLLRHEPAFYRRHALPPGPERQQHCGAFKAEFSQLLDGVLNQPQPGWYAEFSDTQINSYFEEDGERTLKLPECIASPRIAIQADTVRLGFRYGRGWCSTIISIDMRVWLAPKEPNVIALELQALHAGALPVSAQSLLERISDAVRQRNLNVTWYRHNGNPVALLRFQIDQPKPTLHLQELQLRPGMILIRGGAPKVTSPAAASADVGE